MSKQIILSIVFLVGLNLSASGAETGTDLVSRCAAIVSNGKLPIAAAKGVCVQGNYSEVWVACMENEKKNGQSYAASVESCKVK